MIHTVLARCSNGTQNDTPTGYKYCGLVSSSSERSLAYENNETDTTDSRVLIRGAIRHVIQFKACTVLILSLITATGCVTMCGAPISVSHWQGISRSSEVPGCGCECLSTNSVLQTRSTSRSVVLE